MLKQIMLGINCTLSYGVVADIQINLLIIIGKYINLLVSEMLPNPIFYFWGCQGNKGNIYVALPFAVVGNMIGTWEPNSADIADKITANTTSINQNKEAIALKADQVDVNKINGTVSQLQSSLTVQAGQIQEKVTSSQVTGMLAGYATQDYTQSLVTTASNNWNLNLTSLKTDVDAIKANGGGVNLLNGTSNVWTTITASGWMNVTTANNNKTSVADFHNGDKFTYSAVITNNSDTNVRLEMYCCDNNGKRLTGDSYHILSDFVAPNTTAQKVSCTITIDGSTKFVEHTLIADGGTSTSKTVQIKGEMFEDGTVAHTWSPAPSDMATVTSVTNLSATVDGIQAQVYNSDGSSRITQLSNLIATKVSSSDFNNLSQSVNLQTLDSADINNMKTNGHYFVHNPANNPIGGWVYVDVTGNGNDRIRQDVYQDSGIGHKYRRLYGTSWTNWEEGATESQITQLSDAINLRVKSADLISQINLQAGAASIQSDKIVLDGNTTVITGEAFIPSAAISSISADKIMLGSTSLWDSDGTLNLVNSKDGINSTITVTQGSVNFDGTNKTASIIQFASDNNTNAFTVNPTGATVTPTFFFERFGQTVGHWLGFYSK